MHSQYQYTKCSIQSWSASWTIEDEQCQKVGGGVTHEDTFRDESLVLALLIGSTRENVRPIRGVGR
jgi:hypothetical protein